MTMHHITEILPDLEDMPDWAREAFEAGQFFDVAFKRVEKLEAAIVALEGYTSHFDICQVGLLEDSCTCGLNKLLKEQGDGER